jgi:hypothetical protein
MILPVLIITVQIYIYIEFRVLPRQIVKLLMGSECSINLSNLISVVTSSIKRKALYSVTVRDSFLINQ